MTFRKLIRLIGTSIWSMLRCLFWFPDIGALQCFLLSFAGLVQDIREYVVQSKKK